LGQPQGVAHEVGDVLHLRQLVVVGEDHRVTPAAQAVDPLREPGVESGLLSGTDGEHGALSWRFRSD
jgi:hypothetical protein